MNYYKKWQEEKRKRRVVLICFALYIVVSVLIINKLINFI